MSHLFTINEANCTVVLNNRDAIGQLMADTGVTTLDGFNKAAVMIVRQFGHVHNVVLDESTLSEWALGAVTEEDASYLSAFLHDETAEIVKLAGVV